MAKTLPFTRPAQTTKARRNKAMLLPMPRASADDVALQVHLSLALLRSGAGPENAEALLHAHVQAATMADAGYGDLTQEQVDAADAALLACFERGRAGGGWRLDEAGFAALTEIVRVFDEQLQRAPLWLLAEASDRLDRMRAGEARRDLRKMA